MDRNDEYILKLAEELTGTKQSGKNKYTIVVTNIKARITELKLKNISDYMLYVLENPEEKNELVSRVTIHTTFWFREMGHYNKTLSHIKEQKTRNPKVLICGSSSGETTYSVALKLQDLKDQGEIENWNIQAFDIDRLSIQKARLGRYPIGDLRKIPKSLQKYLTGLESTENSEFQICNEIRTNCNFEVSDIRKVSEIYGKSEFDFVVCRNVLIYFEEAIVEKIIMEMSKSLKETGLLIIGHNEFFNDSEGKFQKISGGVYRSSKFSSEIDIKKSSRSPKRNSSSLDFYKPVPTWFKPDIILIGSSTGGTNALVELLTDMPNDMPPIVIVQHIPFHFVGGFGKRLEEKSGLRFIPVNSPTKLESSSIYMTDQDSHLVFSGKLTIDTEDGEPVNSHRPCVDKMFYSASKVGYKRALCMLLTGMGKDGAAGLKELFERGNICIAQDEESSVVYGMPKAAADLGVVHAIGNLQQMRHYLLSFKSTTPEVEDAS